ncbi:MAG: hypothetical protein K2X27_15675, partial [Candidatus Obscuribacterales bacterium]|nr:hypothetical protein [Candidatus Obscuribacterales bacterium]
DDPMQIAYEKPSFPSPWSKYVNDGGETTDDEDSKAEDGKADGGKGKNKALLPPPPPPTAASERPVPPPPPVADAAPQLPIDNLPQPPDKPLVTPSLKLVAILGNKAVLSVPMQLRAKNKWPSVICLSPGERFEDPNNGSFSVVSVDQDSVTIEEEQERSVKSLPQIK